MVCRGLARRRARVGLRAAISMTSVRAPFRDHVIEGIIMSSPIQPHNMRAAAVWSRGGKAYEEISRGIADAIEHCVLRLDPPPSMPWCPRSG
jgi:hypothetical protein